MAYMARLSWLCLGLLTLVACAMDKPETARAFADRWVWVQAQTYFSSARGCTVAVYRLDRSGLRTGARRVYDLRQGVGLLRQGHGVAFADTQTTPDALSRAVMSADLHTGLGLVSSVTGPRTCMSDEVARAVHHILTGQGVITVYDPSENMVLLIDTVSRHAVLMRGPV
ncbi:hypothetical protein M8756_04240 [Lutimaribacter sp. EGI FJ00015]|uniref:Uncharacterized protein n=1 Tax=Lutimaribacter degradans TaxID=2945989 RepID=A0ACC5ZT12_9RHOB|nr:hypothetical protein [Lutimaribacter sp. EGI FJ00013]MCM2560549.1 hypothetical protein [Lutimaribacter sp. EGI FJ00013]MCO0612508.1 hypothetical protein [Lutimaribacter sp. EGI FJ00015]MCO0634373.1 hypothetical protein [Lutimaribacter sp. EGI FJ00014]